MYILLIYLYDIFFTDTLKVWCNNQVFNTPNWIHRILKWILARIEKQTKDSKEFSARAGWSKTPCAGTGDSACRSWRYQCSIVLMHQGNLSITGIFLIRSLPPPDIRGNTQQEQYGFLPDSFFVTNGSIWKPYLTRYSRIFQKPNFHVVKWKSLTFVWKILS